MPLLIAVCPCGEKTSDAFGWQEIGKRLVFGQDAEISLFAEPALRGRFGGEARVEE